LGAGVTRPAEAPQPNADLFCRLLETALRREEEDIRSIGGRRLPAEQFLLSVAFAPETAIGYLVRKAALRLDIPLESERRYAGTTKECVDFCAFHNGEYAASLELKGPIGDWEGTRRLRPDITKHFDQAARVSGAAQTAKRYNAWILVEQTAVTTDVLRERVKGALAAKGVITEFAVSSTIPINLLNNAVYTDRWQHRYENLRVVVFSAELQPVS
jgi:hypothetical protein